MVFVQTQYVTNPDCNSVRTCNSKRAVTRFGLCQLMVSTGNKLLMLCNTFFRTYKEKQYIACGNMRCRVSSVAILTKYTDFKQLLQAGKFNIKSRSTSCGNIGWSAAELHNLIAISCDSLEGSIQPG